MDRATAEKLTEKALSTLTTAAVDTNLQKVVSQLIKSSMTPMDARELIEDDPYSFIKNLSAAKDPKEPIAMALKKILMMRVKDDMATDTSEPSGIAGRYFMQLLNSSEVSKMITDDLVKIVDKLKKPVVSVIKEIEKEWREKGNVKKADDLVAAITRL